SYSKINLSWSDVSAETGYKIERSSDGITGWTPIGTTAANVTSYSDATGLSPATTYFYRVRAVGIVADSDWSDTASATTNPAQPPSAPADLVAKSISAARIDLTWTDTSDNETGFVVERSLDGSTGWTPIATPAAGATTYSNTALSASTTYFYR